MRLWKAGSLLVIRWELLMKVEVGAFTFNEKWVGYILKEKYMEGEESDRVEV